jgi:hypothetical protein
MQPAAETSKNEEDEELHVGYGYERVSCNPFSLASKHVFFTSSADESNYPLGMGNYGEGKNGYLTK